MRKKIDASGSKFNIQTNSRPVLPFPPSPVHPLERRQEIRNQRAECLTGRWQPRHQNVIHFRVSVRVSHLHQSRTQAPADAIAHHRVANLLGDREPKAWAGTCSSQRLNLTPLAFQHETGRGRTSPTPHAQEFGSLFQRLDICRWRHHPTHTSRSRQTGQPSSHQSLRRQTLAALGAAARENANTAWGLHPLAEAMAAFAHEAAWLISTFHVSLRGASCGVFC